MIVTTRIYWIEFERLSKTRDEWDQNWVNATVVSSGGAGDALEAAKRYAAREHPKETLRVADMKLQATALEETEADG